MAPGPSRVSLLPHRNDWTELAEGRGEDARARGREPFGRFVQALAVV